MLKMPREQIILTVMLTLLLMAGCKHQTEASETLTNGSSDPLAIEASPKMFRHLIVGEPSWQEVAPSEQVAAQVETDASRVARVGSPVEGRITKILVLEGQHVKRGQVLARLHSTAQSDAQFSFIKAYSNQQLALRSADRAKQLLHADVIGSAELERRQAELLQATAEVEAIRAKLEGLGMSAYAIHQLETTRKLNSDYPVIATISGTVLERKVTPGQIVQPADMAFQIADLSNVWLVAEVPEDEAAALQVGKSVLATIPALPDLKIKGTLSYLSPVVNPDTRTVEARMNLANKNGEFKPDMMAIMTFESRTEKRQTIPETAIVRENNKDNVFVQTGPHRFVLRGVELGMETGDSRVLKSGLSPGEKLVLNGAFNLNNQRKQDLVKGED
ncbi:MAG: efflux RND transporter periplasmic adaptor subunit [Acidobacteriaceae bacterium]